MKFSEKWLREWVNPPIDSARLVEQLTMAGLEVDSIDAVAPAFEGIVVAEVMTVSPHPDADKLRCCEVNDGSAEWINIVCGASNVRAGLRVPLARVGGVMPGGFKIKKAKLRGEASFGMLCSASELGLEDSSEGLMELPTDAPVGVCLREYLQLDDQVIDVDLTPNRGDCLGIAGIAREVGLLNQCDVNAPEMPAVTAGSEQVFPVSLQAGDACPHYAGRVITGVNAAAETPLWMFERLRRSGIRSISAIVDVTNYVMLELGQPMHAFDLNSLDRGIEIRYARQDEKITLLDGQELTLDEKTLVIADQSRAVALAGIMGGEDSGTQVTSSDIFLESAFFSPELMAGKARQYKLHTDSSHRFERGVDYQLQVTAIERATSLILDICGGISGPVTECLSEQDIPEKQAITLRRERIKRVLGITVDDNLVSEGLHRMGMQVSAAAEGWLVVPPSYRFDISIEADLIEEVARLTGYNNIPNNTALARMTMRITPEAEVGLNSFRNALVNRGYQETITYSFVDQAIQKLIEPNLTEIELANPISSDMSVMRTSLWPGLLQAAKYNLSRQQDRLRLFESGLIFQRDAGEVRQLSRLAGLICGSDQSEQWAANSRTVDFYDLKSDVEQLMYLMGADRDVEYRVTSHPALHPGQSAEILKQGESVGILGKLHPAVSRQLGLDNDVYLFQLDMAVLEQGTVPEFKPVSRFPAVRRDLALLVDEHIEASAVTAIIYRHSPETLKNLQLFDVYRGEGIDYGKKSLALGLTFQRSSSTLTDSEVEESMNSILSFLKQEIGASLRA